jgi:hypothetical protein
MKKNNEMGRLKEEFREFSSLEGISVPKNLSENIFKKIRADLNPPATMVFLKVTFIHLFVGLATLAFCPQFGVSFTSSIRRSRLHDGLWCAFHRRELTRRESFTPPRRS